MNVYDPGNVVTIFAEFTDKTSGDFVDPTTVTATVKNPLGVQTSYVVTSGQIVRDDLGKYSLDLQPDLQGVWSYNWIGTGANKAAKPGAFKVAESQFD
jgi:uncharacterized protein YfaS (alpha-2-macroglobulin family)